MSRKVLRIIRRALCLPLALAFTAGPVAYADPGCCDGCCQRTHCPPPYRHCQEGPPKICYKCACPKPVCPPCELEHWGYYETCWRAWPFPPDWSHCPVPPAAAMIEAQATPMPMPMVAQPGPMVPGAGQGPAEMRINPEQQLPTPRRVPSGL